MFKHLFGRGHGHGFRHGHGHGHGHEGMMHNHMHRGGGRKHGGPEAREAAPSDRGQRMGRGPFGRGGGGGRVFGPGDLRLILLALIEERPRHGYELIKDLEQNFGGGYAPSPGSVYPTLTLLEELGHVRSVTSEGTKRLFEITPEGMQHLRDNQAALNSATTRMDMAARAFSGEAPPAELHHAMHTLKASLMFHRGGWSTEETERVRKLIEDAATAIAGGSPRE
jgi:DNA-binding PadR family transcriptional regulator